jgi:hypothetical protein
MRTGNKRNSFIRQRHASALAAATLAGLEVLENRRLLAAHVGGASYDTIQEAINHASGGDTVTIDPGTYVENLTVDKSITLAGAGQGSTVIEPAFTGADVGSFASLPPGASNVILVRAANVTIHDLTVDGDNPALAGGSDVGGANIDARNGIITDNSNFQGFDNLDVHDVTVKNVFLRGIYSYGGNGFHVADSTVDNVQGNGGSIAIFNSHGTGVIERNTVSRANDAISANWSRGTQFLNNTITQSESGIHTDNNGGEGGVADLIQGNTVRDGTAGNNSGSDPTSYGIWDFVNYANVRIVGNTVNNVDVGLAQFGRAVPSANTLFTGNTIRGGDRPGSVGVYVTTADIGFHPQDASATLTGNSVQGFDQGVFVERTSDAAAGQTARLFADGNDVTRNHTGVHVSGGVALLQGNDLNRNDNAGLLIENAGTVDAGQVGAGATDFTDLGISTGGNDFSKYGQGNGANVGFAIIDLNLASGPTRVKAQGNLFHKTDDTYVQSLIDDGHDHPAREIVDAASPKKK